MSAEIIKNHVGVEIDSGREIKKMSIDFLKHLLKIIMDMSQRLYLRIYFGTKHLIEEFPKILKQLHYIQENTFKTYRSIIILPTSKVWLRLKRHVEVVAAELAHFLILFAVVRIPGVMLGFRFPILGSYRAIRRVVLHQSPALAGQEKLVCHLTTDNSRR